MENLGEYFKTFLSRTAVTIGAPATGSIVGIVSFFEKITPILTVISLITGIVLGILSYRLKLKNTKNKEKD